jgi:2-polyprenyl-6-methoxyphenol hydroxylase-like FAD-dependent oxidoreductase
VRYEKVVLRVFSLFHRRNPPNAAGADLKQKTVDRVTLTHAKNACWGRRNLSGKGSAIIVGGSLTGLALAIALARVGVGVTVLEQNHGQDRGGTGLGVDRELLRAVTGVDATKSGNVKELPVVRTHRETSTWHAIQGWFRAVADATGGIDVLEGARVDNVVQDASSAGVRGNFAEISADVVLGADGYRSVVRRAVDPTNPTAVYGGFVIWRGLIEESWLGELATARIQAGLLPFSDSARLVAYRVPGRDGSTAPGAVRSPLRGMTHRVPHGSAQTATSKRTRSWRAFQIRPSIQECAVTFAASR